MNYIIMIKEIFFTSVVLFVFSVLVTDQVLQRFDYFIFH